MFTIKICGVTSIADAALCAEEGADAIGLNFYEGSSRFVEPALARRISRSLRPEVARVGVFVNTPAAEIQNIARDTALDYVQLHGDESPQDVALLAPLAVVKALRVSADGLQHAERFIDECRSIGAALAAVLIDAATPGHFGGSGQTADWLAARTLARRYADLPLVLAGGLAPPNVAEAIRAVGPAAVDAASGVERSPGCKDPAAVRQFVAAARRAFASAWPPSAGG